MTAGSIKGTLGEGTQNRGGRGTVEEGNLWNSHRGHNTLIKPGRGNPETRSNDSPPSQSQTLIIVGSLVPHLLRTLLNRWHLHAFGENVLVFDCLRPHRLNNPMFLWRMCCDGAGQPAWPGQSAFEMGRNPPCLNANCLSLISRKLQCVCELLLLQLHTWQLTSGFVFVLLLIWPIFYTSLLFEKRPNVTRYGSRRYFGLYEAKASWAMVMQAAVKGGNCIWIFITFAHLFHISCVHLGPGSLIRSKLEYAPAPLIYLFIYSFLSPSAVWVVFPALSDVLLP